MREPGHLDEGVLPYLDRERILACYRASPGREIETGKFASPESSAALAANTFGYFLDRPDALPSIPGLELSRPVLSIDIERTLRFPWAGGRHPWLDAVIETEKELVGIESKRYEPFRQRTPSSFSDTYSRPVWGDGMRRYEAERDAIRAGRGTRHLDAAQLVKHAFGLVTQAGISRKQPILAYLYAEPGFWPDGRPIPEEFRIAHRAEIETFGQAVAGDTVRFVAISYATLLASFAGAASEGVRRHAEAVRAAFLIN